MGSNFSLLISDLRIWVHLGCGEEEKIHPQLVAVNIELIFGEMPEAIFSDNIEHAACYLVISNAIQDLCKQRRFNLIEHMSFEIHKVVSGAVTDKARAISLIEVSLHKVSPPVPGLHGGVHAIYSAPPAI